jgi:hypothetical protein
MDLGEYTAAHAMSHGDNPNVDFVRYDLKICGMTCESVGAACARPALTTTIHSAAPAVERQYSAV